MRPWERRAFNTLVAVVAVTGAAYAWMAYLIQPSDPFAVVNHPWQPAILALHVVAAPVLILLFGIVFNSHVMRKLQGTTRQNRKTGYLSLGTFAAMVGSGYLLQVLTNDTLLDAALVTHLASGAVFTVSYVAHLIIAVLVRRPIDRRIREAA